MQEKKILDEEDFEEILGECEKCGCELTESNIYPKGNKQLCKACAKKGKKKNKLSKPKLITVISVASVVVLTAIILLCYFTIPVKVTVEDAKESYRLALAEIAKREEATVSVNVFEKEGDDIYKGEDCDSWNKNGDFSSTEKVYKNDTIIYDSEKFISLKEKKVYRWNEIAKEGYWQKLSDESVDYYLESKGEGKLWNFVYVMAALQEVIIDSIQFKDFREAYKKGGVTTIVFVGEGEDKWSEYTAIVKLENKTIKSIEYKEYGFEEYGIASEPHKVYKFEFSKKFNKININRDFKQKEGEY